MPSAIDKLPLIKRARECHLYPVKGGRLLDLYLDDGRAVCGHRPPGLSVRMKQVLSLGQNAAYPHVWQGRLEKALLSFFGGFQAVRIYREASLLAGVLGVKPADPLFEDPADVMLWRPYLPIPPECRVMVLRFPLPGWSDSIVVVRDTAWAENNLPPSRWLTPVEASSAVKALALWIAWEKEHPAESYPDFPDCGVWAVRKPWLVPIVSDDKYKAFSADMMEKGIFVYPSLIKPAVIPLSFDRGELP